MPNSSHSLIGLFDRQISGVILVQGILLSAPITLAHAAVIEVSSQGISTIQEGVNAAQAGDTVLVYASGGPYSETVTIQSQHSGITLLGNSDSRPVMDGMDELEAGISLDGAEGVIIRNIEIQNFNIGIRLNGASMNVIADNHMTGNTTGIAVFPRVTPPYANSTNNIIAFNTSSGNVTGMSLFSLDPYETINNFVYRNRLNDNDSFGLVLDGSGTRENVIHNNVATGNEFGINLTDSSGNILTLNLANSNQINGITLDAGSANNRITLNQANNNGGVGFSLALDTQQNRVLLNRAFDNNFLDISNQGASNTFLWNFCAASSEGVDC